MNEHLKILELESTIARRDAVIRILERDLREAKRENRELREKLNEAVMLLRFIKMMAEMDPRFYQAFVDFSGCWTILGERLLAVIDKNRDVSEINVHATTEQK